jgi:hypothetical protein
MAVSMKMALFRDVTLCNLSEVTNISDVLTASIIRVMSKPRAKR